MWHAHPCCGPLANVVHTLHHPYLTTIPTASTSSISARDKILHHLMPAQISSLQPSHHSAPENLQPPARQPPENVTADPIPPSHHRIVVSPLAPPSRTTPHVSPPSYAHLSSNPGPSTVSPTARNSSYTYTAHNTESPVQAQACTAKRAEVHRPSLLRS
jgi:hypothetical protein